MNSVANVQYIIEPSRLNEYPIGSTKLEILRSTPKRSSASRIFGYAASELAVASVVFKLIKKAVLAFFISLIFFSQAAIGVFNFDTLVHDDLITPIFP